VNHPIAAIREFIITNFYVPKGTELTDDASLHDLGIVDSTGVLEITAFLESELGVLVADADLVPENFDSVARIASYVTRKQTEAA
jgi:acyl carrier protein